MAETTEETTEKLPPLVTQSWLANHGSRLTDELVNGMACCYCEGVASRMHPVGYVGRRQLFACLPACEVAYGPDRP